jgi:uncharacterized protein
MTKAPGSLRITGLLAGIMGGLFGGLVGVGGGAVMIPLMTAIGGLSQHKAHGTSLVAIVFTGVIGAATYSTHGAVDWQVSLMLAVSAALTARLGALYAHSLPEKKLKRAFGIFLVFISLMLLVKGHLLHASFTLSFWPRLAVLLATGVCAGFVSGMMGVGGGGVMVPPMVILAGMSQHMAQGTSLLAMVPIAISGALTHWRLGNVDTHVAGGLIVGALVGGYLGATAANMLPELYLKLIFAGIAVWIGTRYIRAR